MAQADEPKKKSKKSEAAQEGAGEAVAPATPEGAAAARKKRAARPTEPAAAKGKSAKAPKGEAAEKGEAPAARAKRPTRKAKGEGDEARAAQAMARYVRMAPRKLRLVMDAIRGKNIKEARGILQFCGKRAAGPLAKVLNSAVANAENNHSMNAENLYVATAWVDQGPSIKGWIPRARGRASQVHKFSSHITIVVKEREEV